MNDLVHTQQDQSEPFKRAMTAPGGNVGAIAIESERAIAEAQGQLILAKRFPRSMSAATVAFLDACKSPEFASTAFYAVPNRGSGPSIRFAEEAARCYGNFEYGHRELSRTPAAGGQPGKSEIEVYAWDKELNNRSIRQITVEHVLDSRQGPRKLTDQADIDNKIANVASKQMRGRILALMPKGMIAAGIAEAKKTIAGGNEKPHSDRIIALAGAFSKYGVTNDHLVKYLGHPVDQMTLDEFADLKGIGTALKEGGKASEYFPMGDQLEGDAPAAVQAITDAAAGGKKTAATAGATTAGAAQTTQPRATRQPSKTAQSASNPVKDEAPAPASEPPQAEQIPPAESAPEPAAQQSAGDDEEEVF